MGNELIEIEEYRDLKDKFDSMTKYYLSLIEEKEDLLFKEKVLLEAKYLSIFGYLIKQKLQREIDLRRIKKKISLIQFYLNKGEKVDKEEIEKKLEEEMKLFKFQMEDFKERLSQSKKLIESPTLTDEEYNEVKSIFRKLAKKLHPDLNKILTEREMNLWNRTLQL
ncbi:hypothetical protein [Clostridium sp. 'White wine YQ']|uniref:hypothetical protein n=1 Tax=Clostridium sp. 'White wine YQ' TaxID=3027474 RepID=UPI0023651139|nr:hypothetical protein [Clostridium sp. 'White wine YQ']MDD7794359.1 hypothetical protein [Clostridium sp. 'White wine YQ']